MPKARTPRKSPGVPKETARTSVAKPLAALLGTVFPDFNARQFHATLKRRKYLAASLMRQVEILTEILSEIAANKTRTRKLIDALRRSDFEKIRGLAGPLVRIVYGDDCGRALKELESIAVLEGTWPREAAQMAIHALAIRHGSTAVLHRTRTWLDDPREALRRAVIEALRPRGVWVPHIPQLRRDPAPLKPLFDRLIDDPSKYVRTAVANNLNDISKDHPEIVCRWVADWLHQNPSSERSWIANRALRTLLKNHHPQAQRALGLSDGRELRVLWKRGFPRAVRINQFLSFDIEVTNTGRRSVAARLQAVMTGPGKGARPRVSRYLLGTVKLNGGHSARITKDVHFIHRNSQPKLPGRYTVTVSLNGSPVGERSFVFEG